MNTNAKTYFDAILRDNQDILDVWAMRVPSYDPAPLLSQVHSWERNIADGEHVSHFSFEGSWGKNALDRLYVAAAYQVADRCAALAGK